VTWSYVLLRVTDQTCRSINVVLFEMRAERNSCARNVTLDWIEFRSGENLLPLRYVVCYLLHETGVQK